MQPSPEPGSSRKRSHSSNSIGSRPPHESRKSSSPIPCGYLLLYPDTYSTADTARAEPPTKPKATTKFENDLSPSYLHSRRTPGTQPHGTGQREPRSGTESTVPRCLQGFVRHRFHETSSSIPGNTSTLRMQLPVLPVKEKTKVEHPSQASPWRPEQSVVQCKRRNASNFLVSCLWSEP